MHRPPHWSCLLQYILGFAELGCDVFWLELMRSTGQETRDQRLIDSYFSRFRKFGFKGRSALRLCDKNVAVPTLSTVKPFGVPYPLAGRRGRLQHSGR